MTEKELIPLDEFIKSKSKEEQVDILKQLEDQEAYEICSKVKKVMEEDKV